MQKMRNKNYKYHGTDAYFEYIDLGRCKVEKDFGQGFYLADNYNSSYRWAKKRAASHSDWNRRKGYIYTYEITEGYLKSKGLNVHRFNGTSYEWLDFVASNRTIDDFHHDFDVVIGPIADAAAVEIIDSYVKGGEGDPNDPMTKNRVISKLQLTNYGIQYCFCTQKAINAIQSKRVDAEEIYF